MNEVFKLGKKVFTFGVVATTIMWSVGVAALAPVVAQAADDVCPAGLMAGDLIKIKTSPVIYALDKDMRVIRSIDNQVPVVAGVKKYVSGLLSWNVDSKYIGIKQISNYACIDKLGLSSMKLGPRPGSYVIKNPITSELYAVLPGMVRAKISLDIAKKLYGTSFVAYPVVESEFGGMFTSVAGPEITEAIAHEGMFVKKDNKTWYVDAGKKLIEVTDSGLTANRVKPEYVRTYADAQLAGLIVDSSVKYDAYVAKLGDRSQSGISGTVIPPVVVVSGTFAVTLAASTPGYTAVPYKSTHVPYLVFNLNSLNAGTVYSVTLKRVGLGSNNNFAKVWLEVNGTPVSNSQTVSSDDTVTLTPNLAVAAGNTTFTVVANLDATTGANTAMEDAFQVTAIDGGAGVTASGLPVTGNKMSYRQVNNAAVTLADKGSNASVKVGDTATLGEFSLQYNSGNDTKGSFEYIRLRNTGDANLSDLKNLVLMENGVAVSAPATVVGDYATFKLNSDAKLVGDSKTRNFEIKAEIQAGEDGKTYLFVLKDARDIFVNDTYNGFGASITMDNMDAGSVAGALRTYDLDAGQMSVSADVTNPNNSKYTKNTKTITALVAKMKLGQAVNVEGLKVYLASGTTLKGTSITSTNVNADIERVQLYVGDRRISTLSAVTATTLTAITNYYYDFDTAFSMKNGDLVKLVVDLKPNAVTSTYKFTFAGSNFVTPEYTNGDTVTDVSGSATSNNLEITNSSVTVTRNDGYTDNKTFMIGGTSQKLFQAVISAGSSADVYLKTLKFSMSSSSMSTYFTNMYITFDGVKFDLTKDMASGGTVDFTGIAKKLAKNGQTTVALYTDVASGLTTGSTSTFTLANTDNGSVLEDIEGTATAYTAQTSPVLMFVSNATLTPSLDANTTKTSIATAGTTVDLGTWRLSDLNGGVNVTDVYVANTNGTAVTTSQDFLVSTYQLVWRDNVIASVSPVSGLAHFDLPADKYIAVANGGTEKFTVRAVLNNIDGVANTGKLFQMSLYGIEALNGNGSSLTHADSANVVGLTEFDGDHDVPANVVQVVKTQPALATVNSVGTLSNGESEIYRFTVSAPTAGDVSWNKVVLSIGGSCTGGAIASCLGATTTGNMYLKTGGDTVAASFVTSTGKLTVTLTTLETVAANSTKTYYVIANLANFTVANDTLTVSVKTSASETSLVAPSTSAISSDTFRWTDNSGVYESTNENSWFAGYKVLGLDTASYKLVK